MLKKIFFFILILIASVNIAYAQSDTSSDATLGGTAVCHVSGRSPVKEFTGVANRLLILQNSGISNASIQLQLITDKNPISLDIDILALLGQIADVQLFLGGKALDFNSSSSTFSITKTNKTNNISTTLTNQIGDSETGSIAGKIKIKNNNNLVSGILNLKLGKSLLTKSVNSTVQQSDDKNGKVTLRCMLKDIPLQIKPASI